MEMIKAKAKWISEQCDIIENSIKESNSKKAFDTLKKPTRKQQQHKATDIEDKDGFLLTDYACHWSCNSGADLGLWKGGSTVRVRKILNV